MGPDKGRSVCEYVNMCACNFRRAKRAETLESIYVFFWVGRDGHGLAFIGA